MKLHGNARTCPRSRRLLVERVECGWTLQRAAAAAGISERTAAKWCARWRAEGERGLLDRSSRPLRQPRRTPEDERSLDRAPCVALAREMERDRTSDPDQRKPRGRADEYAAQRIERAQRREDERSAERVADHGGDRLEQHGTDGRAAEAEERSEGRVAAPQYVRRDARPDIRACEDAREREHAREESAAEADEGSQRDNRDCDPVDASHARGAIQLTRVTRGAPSSPRESRADVSGQPGRRGSAA